MIREQNDFNEEEPVTNYDVIRNMNPVELSIMHRKTSSCRNCPAYSMCKEDFETRGLVDVIDCQTRHECWLRQEVKK